MPFHAEWRPRGLAPADLRSNLVAGVVAGIIALPLSIALAVAVGVPPIAGLYTAVFAGAAASIFGGSRYNITGPTAALVPLLSHVVLTHGARALPMVGLMAGAILVVIGFPGFGRLVHYMPGTVIVGFTAGIALSIAFGQLNALLGVTGTNPAAEHFHERTFDTLRHLGTVGWTTPLVGVASLAILIAWPRIDSRIPATAAIARTAASIRAGATSRFAGVVHSATVLALTVALGPLAGHIPLTTLAAILLVTAWKIAEVPEVTRLLRRAPREDAVVLVATIAITLFLDLTYAIGFGVLASTVLLVRRLSTMPAAAALLPDPNGRIAQVSDDLAALIRSRPDIDIFSVQGLLSFHSARSFEYQLEGDAHRPLILRMKDVHHIDTTGLLTLEGIIEHRQHRGGRVILTAIQPEIRPVLERFGILDLLGPQNVFEHTKCAIASIDHPELPPPDHERTADALARAS